MIDTILASDNSSCFRKNLSERMQKLIMTSDGKFRDEKLKYDIIREAARNTALSPGKIDKSEFLTVKEILPSLPSRKMEQAKFILLI